MDLSKLQEVFDSLLALQVQIEQMKAQGADAAAQLEAEKAISKAEGLSEGEMVGYEKGKADGYAQGFLDGKASIPNDETPFSQADIDSAIQLAVGPLNEKIAALEARVVELEASQGATPEQIEQIKSEAKVEEKARLIPIFQAVVQEYLDKEQMGDDELKSKTQTIE